MTEQHPITPPPELVEQWIGQAVARPASTKYMNYFATKAARWGADQELEACCEWFVRDWTDIETADKLRAVRRPKPPSLKEQALAIVENLGICDHLSPENERIIRSALESLPD